MNKKIALLIILVLLVFTVFVYMRAWKTTSMQGINTNKQSVLVNDETLTQEEQKDTTENSDPTKKEMPSGKKIGSNLDSLDENAFNEDTLSDVNVGL